MCQSCELSPRPEMGAFYQGQKYIEQCARQEGLEGAACKGVVKKGCVHLRILRVLPPKRR